MILTLSGTPGSGKTAAAKLLAERLGWQYVSVGNLRAALAEERGITIDELNKIGETDPTTDTTVDERMRTLGETADNLIVEGRLAWHFIPHSFKVYLTCDPMEAARRIYLARKNETGREDEPLYATIEAAANQIKTRVASDRKRYQTHYGLDFEAPSHYDLVLDTTKNPDVKTTVEQMMERIPKE